MPDMPNYLDVIEGNLEEREAKLKGNVQRIYTRQDIPRGLMEAFELIGGVPRLVLWANENYGEFLKLYVKMAPKEAASDIQGSITYISNVPQSPLNRRKKSPELLENVADG